MRSDRIPHIRPQVLVILLVVLSLLCAGARVPDLSRPNRPKPLHRVTFELQQKNLSSQLKQHHDLVAVLPKVVEAVAVTCYGTVVQSTPTLRRSSAVIPHSGRAPPEQLQG
ncbi:hypothetical protein E4633_11965 [Geomonas terrae]|uniref:Uncharacterized protein n=1 Tax=Geomonas terrae TaxID=2562681 RepID=A0A4S1CCE6_9BACT|nr:hypothetical protein [Geomonas terrae]TGU71057.1 hypothetical protein E4633_11965 [Geomonas terrae]